MWGPDRSASRSRAAAFAALAACALGAPLAARADAPPRLDPAVVELYREARELVNAGKWDEACPKFDRARAMQPTASILVNVGDCHAHAGKLVQALDDYEAARALNEDTRDAARRAAIEAEIDARVKELGPRVPRLRIVVENPAPGMVVRRDGAAVPAGALDTDVRVDPGAHVVTAEAPGHAAAPLRITLAEGETERVTVRLESTSFASRHAASLAVAGGAVALAGAGAALAGWTVATHASLGDVCGAGSVADCDGRKEELNAGAIATNVAFAAAGAAAAAAVLVFAVAERPGSPSVRAAISGTHASLRVSW